MGRPAFTDKVSFAKGIWNGLCPSCRVGKVFEHGMLSPNFLAIHADCSVCGAHYEPEPGFFWGAMYFNYAFNVLMLATMGLMLHFGFHAENVYIYIVGMLSPVLLAIPLTARLSRMLWLYVFGPFKYQPGSQHSGKS